MSFEIDYKKLKELDIDINKRDNSKPEPQKMLCPLCKDKRKQEHMNDLPLAVYWSQCRATCFNCNEHFFFGKTHKLNDGVQNQKQTMNKNTQKYKKPAKLTNETAPDEEVQAWFAGRSIPAEVVLQEGVTQTARTFQQTGNVEKCIFFPYFVKGELTNRKYRTVTTKNFMLEGGARLTPWRIDHILDTPECIITEGEMDALSFLVAGRDDVISVPNGAQKNLSWLEDFIETHLENKQRIYIASDTDKKGLELREELVRRFGEEKCRIVTYGEGCKDANELLMQSGAEALRRAIAEAQEVPIDGVFTAEDVRDELKGIFEHGLQKGAVFGMGDLDDLLSVEVGRLMIVTGIPGHGKSEMLDEMALHLSLNVSS